MGVDHVIRLAPDNVLDQLLQEPKLWWDDWERDWVGHRFPPIFDSIKGWDRLRWLLDQYDETKEVAKAVFQPGERMVGECDEYEWVRVLDSEVARGLADHAIPTMKRFCRTRFPLDGMAEADLYHAGSLETESEIDQERQFLQQLLGDLTAALERAVHEQHGFLISHG